MLVEVLKADQFLHSFNFHTALISTQEIKALTLNL
jgi:hypothetical protein